MVYQSTRDSSLEATAAQAIVKGLAPDGGLYVPKEKPQIGLEDLQRLADMNYRERACGILGMFLTDFTSLEIEACVSSAYNKAKFETDSIAPVYDLGDSAYILELWHGPTCAFKDMALQILPHLLTTSMKKTGVKEQVVILVATSGDTGKAALEGFKDVEGTKIIVFFPENGVSKIQRLQMLTQEGKNVAVASVRGNFDDAQAGVKQIFSDQEYARMLKESGFVLSSANSINWGRLVPQVVYYISAYCDLMKAGKIHSGEEINVCVPTGNFGNILAAWYAKQMGLPIQRLICASNANRVLTDFISMGTYDRNRQFYTTTSPSMDILISSNLERLLFDLTDCDSAQVAAWMKELAAGGRYQVSDAVKEKVARYFYGGYCDDEGTAATIEKVWREYSYLMDTHTAVAYHVYEDYVKQTGDTTKTVIASTANPFKFNGSVLQAISHEQCQGINEFELLDRLSQKTGQKIPASLDALRSKTPRFVLTCEKEQMPQVVKDILLK